LHFGGDELEGDLAAEPRLTAAQLALAGVVVRGTT
jgi:hypothetical protein